MYHADEGVQSYQVWRLIEEGVYRYDPQDNHGPLLYYLAKWLPAFVSDEFGELSDASLRRLPMAFSMCMVAFGLIAFFRFGSAVALVWGGFVALAPLSVIYGAYFVQESMLACFTLVSGYLIFRYVREPSWGWVIGIGIGIGLMHVTKETAWLHIVAMLIAILALAFFKKQRLLPHGTRIGFHFLTVLVILLAFHCLFFSSFFENESGIWDGIRTFLNYADRSQGQGHEKAWWYYGSLMLPRVIEGVRWGEVGLLFTMLIGCLVSFRLFKTRRSEAAEFGIYVTVFGLILVLMYSLIPYKNPWLLLTPYIVLSYTAGIGLVGLGKWSLSRKSGVRWLTVSLFSVLVFGVFGELAIRTRSAIFRYPSAVRNPYIYQHTTPRYGRLLESLERLHEADSTGRLSLGVFSPDHSWPLPWHLRNWERVGYWDSLEDLELHTVDLFDTRLLTELSNVGNETDFWNLYGLRPNTLLALRVSNEFSDVLIERKVSNATD